MGRNNQTTGGNRVAKRGFARPEKLGQNKEAGNKMAWGRRGRGHIQMITQTGGTREATLQLPPARERWEWSCITWTREQGYKRGFTPVTPC